MADGEQGDLLSGIDDVSLMRFLLEDLHDGLLGKVQRFRYCTISANSMGAGRCCSAVMSRISMGRGALILRPRKLCSDRFAVPESH